MSKYSLQPYKLYIVVVYNVDMNLHDVKTQDLDDVTKGRDKN
jgi:hypothetical protein